MGHFTAQVKFDVVVVVAVMVVVTVVVVGLVLVITLLRHGRLTAPSRLVILIRSVQVTVSPSATAIPRATATSYSVLLGALEALLTPQVAAVLEHVARLGVQRPVAALTWAVGRARHLEIEILDLLSFI